MATFVKDVLYPGSYSVSDGKGGRRTVTYTAAQVKHLSQRMKDMLAAGLAIPLAAEHQEQAKPLTEAERKADWVKRLTMGWAAQADLAPEGFLTTQVEVPVEEDARRMPAVRFVSPEIVDDFVDGNGKLWPGPSISHLAVTPRPVQHNQKPFQPVRMSNVVRLSLTDYVALSEGPPVADETPPPDPAVDTPAPEIPAKASPLKDLLAALREDGYALPEDTSDENFIDRLHTAALTKKATLDQILADSDDAPPPGGEPEPAPGGGPVMMSLGGHRFSLTRLDKDGKPVKPSKPAKPAKPATQLSLDGSDNPYAKRLLLKERESIQGRIKALFTSGRITKPIADKLTQQAGTVRLSLDAQGGLASNDVLAKVEAYEELGSGAAWPVDPALLQDVQTVPDNPQWSGNNSREAIDATVDDFFSMLPGGRQPAAK